VSSSLCARLLRQTGKRVIHFTHEYRHADPIPPGAESGVFLCMRGGCAFCASFVAVYERPA